MNFCCSNEKYLKNILGDILRNYQKDSVVNISYEVLKQEKTLKQLGFIFGGLIKAIRRYFANVGYNYPIYAIKQWLYQECGVYQTETLPNGVRFQTSKTLSEMTKEEASNFIEDVIYFIDTSGIFDDFVLPPELRYCWTHNVDAERLEHLKKSVQYANFDSDYLRRQSGLTCIKCGARGGMVYHLDRRIKKDYLTLPLCAHCYDYVTTQGESYLIKDIKSVLNGLTVDDFCLYSYYLFKKAFI